MNVLLSVFECNPLRGSDSYVGWSYVINAAKYNNVYALTRTANKADIEKYCDDMKVDMHNIHFIYVDQSKFFTEKIYKINHYFGFLGSYFVWQKSAYKAAKKLMEDVKIDVCHHVSIADFRCAGKLWKLNIPFIFGPVGGGQETPDCFSDYVKSHWKGEWFRKCMNEITTLVPSYRKALERAAIIYSSNDETSGCIRKRMPKKCKSKLVQMTELCIDQKYLEERENIQKEDNPVVHIIVSGRLIYRKGIQVLLEAVTRMDSLHDYKVDIYGEGDQRSYLEKFVEKSGLENKVTFHGKIPFDEMQNAYKNADIYVLPSLRESTGTAVFEALANKLPVITFNQNGAKYVVENDAGILVDLNNKEQVLNDLAKALDTLVNSYELRKTYGECGFNKLKNQYTWNRRAEQMAQVYENLQ